jgi:hypothetical protein
VSELAAVDRGRRVGLRSRMIGPCGCGHAILACDFFTVETGT